jgi:hypothetical protein
MDHEGEWARCADGQDPRPASGRGSSMEKVRTVWLTSCGRLQTGPAALAAAYKDTTVWINTHNFGDSALPFGGYK